MKFEILVPVIHVCSGHPEGPGDAQSAGQGAKSPARQVPYKAYAQNFDAAFPNSPKRRAETWAAPGSSALN